MTSNSSNQRPVNIKVRPLTLKDVKRFGTWGHHTEILFHGYDFPDLASLSGGYALQSRLWFYKRHVPFFRWLYAIEDSSGNLAGYLKAVRKSILKGRAEISIVLDPAFMDRGYGSEATAQFLRICFQDLNLKELWLRVLQLNIRARRVYEKAGFEYFKIREEPFDDDSNQEELLRRFPEAFFIKDGRLMSRYHYMKLSRQSFESK